MMKHLMICYILLIGSFPLMADKSSFPVSSVNEDLITEANIIVRKYDIDFEVHSVGKAVKRFHRVVTLLNETAKDQAHLIVGYDHSIKVKSLDGKVYDASGKEIRKFRKSDIRDFSSISNFSLYEDNRVKVIEFTPPFYPVTIEYEYELEYDGLVGYPSWIPVNQPKMSLENSSFRISIPKELELRYKPIHLSVEPEVNVLDECRVYYWKTSDISAVKEWESYMPGFHKLKPVLLTAPADFEYEGHEGNLETWENFGKWIYDLNKNRDNLPEETINKIRQLTAGKAEIEKIRVLYRYLQEKTRYVSIQLGIGGFQPFEATVVDEVSYGDCKALSNYMKAILKVAGIDSYPAIINAGADHYQVIRDFPTFQFNHQILCVPVQKDTIWLECTSQHIPPGYLGNFTGNRYALVVNESGGKLVKTKTYLPEDNYQYRKAIVHLKENGNASADITTRYGGYQFKRIRDVSIKSADEQKKWQYENIDLQGLKIEDLTYNYGNDKDSISEEINMLINNYAAVSGKRIFLNPNLMNRRSNKLTEIEDRKTQFKIDYSYFDVDTIIYHIPKQYHIEFAPEDKEFKSPFGSYSTSVFQKSSGEIIYIRELKINRGLYSPELYGDFRLFVNKIVDSDHEKVIIKNKT